MAKNTALTSWTTVGTMEDMTDFVTNLDPDRTLLTNKMGRTKVTSTKHEWLSDSIRPAMENAHEEVVDFETIKANPRRRMENYCQQLMYGYNVSDVTQAIKKWGVRDEVSYQMVKAGKELAGDLEYAIIKNKTKALFSDGTKGMMGGIPYFLTDEKQATVASNKVTSTDHGLVTGDAVIFRGGTGGNTVDNRHYYVAVVDKDNFYAFATPEDAMKQDAKSGTGAVNPGTSAKYTFQNLVDAKKADTKGALSFDMLNDAMQLAWERGGNIDIAVMSGRNKRNCAQFDQGVVKTRAMQSKELTETLDVIETDFGTVELVAHRMYADDVVDLLELQYWKLGFLIPIHMEKVPRTGTYQEQVLTGVCTLECTAPNSSARIEGLNGQVEVAPLKVEHVNKGKGKD